MKKRGGRILRWAALAVAAALAAGCSSGLGRPVHEVRATPGGDGVQRVELRVHAFYFDPNRIVLKANVPVELHVKNHSAFIPHNFTCDAPEAGIQVEKDLGLLWDGETALFTPTRPGEYKFFCDVDSHAKKGMTGVLVVVR
jgi:uncharacterized cupredoxin-like copper-binding protein